LTLDDFKKVITHYGMAIVRYCG